VKSLAVAAAVAVVFLSSCGAQNQIESRSSNLSAQLKKITREGAGPSYWLGPSFEGLPLTHAEGSPSPPAAVATSTERAPEVPPPPSPAARGPFFVYGECNGEGDGDSFHCTGPQVQVQHWPIASPSRYPDYISCTRTLIRGVPAAQFDGFEVYVGRSLVRIYAPTQAQARRAGAALRSLDGSVAPSEPLPRPAIDVEQALERCALDSLEVKLTELRQRARIPLLWAGRRFEELPLFRSEGDGQSARFLYGGCETPEVAGSCYPELTLDVTPAADRRPAGWNAVRKGIVRCARLRVRGTDAAVMRSAHELTVFTGSIAVLLRGPDLRRLRRAADALEPFDGPAKSGALAPPSDELRDELRRTCPAQAG
jgi:hypothetical protein